MENISLDLINRVSTQELLRLHPIVREIVHHKKKKNSSECDLPGDYLPEYYKTMLKRYLFAGTTFCRGKEVLDVGCGYGWGPYLLSCYAEHIFALDPDQEAITWAENTWVTPKVTWLPVDLYFMEKNYKIEFDVITLMEVVEHFEKEDAQDVLRSCTNFLKEGGMLIGTSTFPNTRTEANNLSKQNKHHPYIWTKEELINELSGSFKNIQVVDNWMFFAEKAKSLTA